MREIFTSGSVGGAVGDNCFYPARKELRKGNRNKATLAIARKLVAYMLAVDKSGQEFQVKESDMAA